jgi:hypothetical protein
MEASNSQNILPACLLPRRRFVRWCLLTFFLFNLVCVMVRFYAVHHPDWSVLWGDLEPVGLMFLLVFAPLLIPVRTKRGSLLQVSGLFFVLLALQGLRFYGVIRLDISLLLLDTNPMVTLVEAAVMSFMALTAFLSRKRKLA